MFSPEWLAYRRRFSPDRAAREVYIIYCREVAVAHEVHGTRIRSNDEVEAKGKRRLNATRSFLQASRAHPLRWDMVGLKKKLMT